MPRFCSCLAVLLLLSAPSAAGTLAPRKASEIVLLTTSIGATGCALTTEYRFDSRLLPDGTSEPFAIPAKRVLVITSIDFFSSAGTAGKRYSYALILAGVAFLAVADAGLASADGNVVGSTVIPTGVVVAPGSTLCSQFQDGAGGEIPAFARLHGFFAKDK